VQNVRWAIRNVQPAPHSSPILDAVNAANQTTPPVPKTSLTLKIFILEWRAQVAEGLKPSSRKSAESHLRRHIVPLLGDCALTELTTKSIRVL